MHRLSLHNHWGFICFNIIYTRIRIYEYKYQFINIKVITINQISQQTQMENHALMEIIHNILTFSSLILIKYKT